jgi:ABC-2 type transport system ATP-binding protein
VLFLDEPTNGVDPVSRRDFWAILYQLIKDGMTVFVTTAYLDEAERANRVGLIHRGRLIRCDSPAALRTSLAETCWEVRVRDRRAAREILQHTAGVVSAEPAGDTLHVFVSPGLEIENVAALGEATVRRIEPSLEDVFIALIRKEEARAEVRP